MKSLILTLFVIAFSLNPIMAQADSIVLGPTDFVPFSDEANFVSSNSGLYLRPGSPISAFLAPIHLPSGARISSVILFYVDNSATCNIQINIIKTNIFTSTHTIMADWTTSGSSSVNPLIHKITPIIGGYSVNNTGYFYNVFIYFNDNTAGTNCTVMAVKIIYY